MQIYEVTKENNETDKNIIIKASLDQGEIKTIRTKVLNV